MRCCGVTTYEDWYDISSWRGERWVPESCCRPVFNQTSVAAYLTVEGSGDDGLDCARSQNPSLWWDRGCTDVLQSWIVHRLCVVGTVALVIAFLQVRNVTPLYTLFIFNFYHWSIPSSSA